MNTKHVIIKCRDHKEKYQSMCTAEGRNRLPVAVRIKHVCRSEDVLSYSMSYTMLNEAIAQADHAK